MFKTTSITDAMAAGYRVNTPDKPSKSLVRLCDRLGPEYHLATIDGCNVIHRVIGDGWDVEIWRAGRRKYNITLWKDYGCESVISETDIKDVDDAIQCMVEMMLHVSVPESVYPTRYSLGPRPKPTSPSDTTIPAATTH